MSGINHLYDIYHKKGDEFVDHLFNTFVTVNEKMDGSAFTFERDKETGKFKFYRRDQRNPITFVDRTLMKYYEKPINYIESLPPHILEKIPRGWRFGLEYFSSTKPVEIMYDRIPKNHLILSYVHEYGQDGKIKKTIQDKGELDSWADLLGIDRAPIIFQGYLNDDQKNKILEFLRTPFGQLVEKFKTQSFVRFIISTLNPDLSKTALNEDLDKDVEGIVFRFGNPSRESEPVLAKMVDPVFTELAKQKASKQKETKPSDFLGISLLDVMNFILEKGLDRFRVEGNTEDERYVSFMSDVFVNFLNDYSDKYRGADFEEPEYLKREEFRLNKDLIDDRRVLKYVNEDESFESLFKLMLNSFRKIKMRPGGIVTKGMMEQFNLLVGEIKDYIQRERKGKMNESSFPSFLDFRTMISPEVQYLKEEDEETEADENPFYSYGEFINTLETIDSSNPIKEENKEEDLKEVNLLVGRFQPFHNGHLKMAKSLKGQNGLQSVVIVVYPGHNKSGKSPFSEDTIRKYMDGIVRDEEEIADYIIVPRGLIGSAIVKLLEKGYKPNLVGAGEDRMKDYTKQIEYVLKSEIGDKVRGLELVQTPRTTSATEVREAIMNDDSQKVKRLVPKSVYNMYSALRSEATGQRVHESRVNFFDSGYQERVHHLVESSREFPSKIQKYFWVQDPSETEIRRVEKIHSLFSQVKNITRDSDHLEEKLMEIIPEMLFCEGGDTSSKIEKIEDFIHHLDSKTIRGLSESLIQGDSPNSISFQTLLSEGMVEIDSQGFNGIHGQRDIEFLYNIDSKIAVGNNKRGKGETLFCFSFGAKNNPNKGGDVFIDLGEGNKKIIEVKSTNNAGITPSVENDPEAEFGISKGVEESLKMTLEIFEEDLKPETILELRNSVFQKNSTEDMIQVMNQKNEKCNLFISSLAEKFGVVLPLENLGRNFISFLLLDQLNHYSKRGDLFESLAIFVEDKNKFPSSIVLLDSESEKTFFNSKNFDLLRRSGIAPKITKKKRMEIYTFEKINLKSESN
jgi:nicotinamide mononucleotide adenylyltransferase